MANIPDLNDEEWNLERIEWLLNVWDTRGRVMPRSLVERELPGKMLEMAERAARQRGRKAPSVHELCAALSAYEDEFRSVGHLHDIPRSRLRHLMKATQSSDEDRVRRYFSKLNELYSYPNVYRRR
jgi:hypothetical protein